MFYLFDVLIQKKICLKIILSNRCELLIHACWIYLEHAKHAEAENFQRNNKPNNQRPRNLRSKEGGFAKLTIIFHVIFFSFSCHWGYRNVLVFPEKTVWFIGFFFRQEVRESFWLFSLLAFQNIDVFQLSPKSYLRELFISRV